MNKDPKLDLTVEQFNKLYDDFTNETKQELEEIKNPKKSDKVFLENKDLIWETHCIKSNSLANLSMNEVIKSIKSFKKRIKKQKDKLFFEVTEEAETDSDYDGDTWIEFVGFKATWLGPRDEVSEYFLNNKFKSHVNNWLKPNKEVYTRTIDCKLLTLFKDGKIDWTTLRTLVYSDCKI